jgi:hypothetical protein
MESQNRSAMTAPRAKPFSMIREFHLADWFTLGNAVSGTGAIFSAMSYLRTGDAEHIYFAAGLVFAALLFDIFDGRIARWRQKTSAMGRELDSLADVISFGVAPALIGYAVGMQGLYGSSSPPSWPAGCHVSRVTTSRPKHSRKRPGKSLSSRARPFPPRSYSWVCWPGRQPPEASATTCGWAAFASPVSRFIC